MTMLGIFQWGVSDVLTWAQDVAKLPQPVIDALARNEIDGHALLSITEAEVQSKLGVESEAARGFVWDALQDVRYRVMIADFAVAVDLNEKEIANLSAPDGHHLDHKVLDVLTTSIQPVLQQILDDNAFAWSLQGSVAEKQFYDDRAYALKQQELHDQQCNQSVSDHQFAMSLSRNPGLPNVAEPQRTEVPRLFKKCIDVCIDEKINVARALRPDNVRENNQIGFEERKEEVDGTGNFILACHVCFEERIEGFTLPCQHANCRQCLRQLFRTALGDSSLLPLRCCELPIDMNIVDYLLKPREATTLKNRVIEISAHEKLYCPGCGVFTNLDLVDTSESTEMQCHGCGITLCVVCKTVHHPMVSCETNKSIDVEADRDFKEFANQQGWKHCPQCNITIEFISGCNHMTCESCSHHFCFKCLEPWDRPSGFCSSGTCERWDEGNLVVAGEARVRAEEVAQGLVFQPEQRLARQDRHIRALLTNEICTHIWRRQEGYHGECERCGYGLYMYGMVCRSDCGTSVCYTCAHHRIPSTGWR
jgi:IBR domain, a half RING-finger domain/Zinc finger, C3HC4 type (RING finger)